MKYNINKQKFNGKKYKLKVFVPILCGTILATGCSWKTPFNYYDPNNIGYESTVEDTQTKEYGVTLVLKNIEVLNQKNYIYFWNLNNRLFEQIHAYETEYELTTYVPNYLVSCEALGRDLKVEVNLEEDEKAIIYIDYLAKTIDVEKEKIHVR